MSQSEIVVLVAVVIVLIAGLATLQILHRRRTGKLREQFGGAEYEHALKEGGSQRRAEAELGKRAARVESFHLQPLVAADRTRFEASWSEIQARFVDGPGGSVAEADRLLNDVMSARGYPVSDFAQHAADLSVDHPLVIKNYRVAHEIAQQQARGQASTEDLRQAMIHYRTLVGELVNAGEAA